MFLLQPYVRKTAFAGPLRCTTNSVSISSRRELEYHFQTVRPLADQVSYRFVADPGCAAVQPIDHCIDEGAFACPSRSGYGKQVETREVYSCSLSKAGEAFQLEANRSHQLSPPRRVR